LVDGDQDGQPVNRYGHLLGFTTKGGAEAARAVMDALQMIWRATDLGRIKSVATFRQFPRISSRVKRDGRSPASPPI